MERLKGELGCVKRLKDPIKGREVIKGTKRNILVGVTCCRCEILIEFFLRKDRLDRTPGTKDLAGSGERVQVKSSTGITPPPSPLPGTFGFP